ncbi:MAG: 3-dehydroquinate synthase [Clostridiales bacterium]|nr:3-dehydroquinate synthase [Clostridiales bacterium]
MRTVEVAAPGRTYSVEIGGGLLKNAGKLVSRVIAPCRAVIVTDDIVDGLYAGTLESSLKEAGFETFKYVFENGERTKNAASFVSLLNFLANNRLLRTDAIFALGGGVTGDLAGFAASVYLRGIKLIQLPTTLLAAVDSSVGGKTAIDLEAGKNLAGTFYQPELVICDTDTLDTLPAPRLSDGFAEIIKYAMICDRAMFYELHPTDAADLADLIFRCVKIKSDIVAKDERDNGIRQLLNFGHTFGHAIEKCSGYSVSHGSAVAAGMSVITAASAKMGLCGPHCPALLKQTLLRYRLPTTTALGAEELFEAVLSDKKRGSSHITLVVPEDIGRCVLRKTALGEAAEFLRLGL